MQILVKTIPVPGKDTPNTKRLKTLLDKAIEEYGVKNVQIYVNTDTDQGYKYTYLNICCYKKVKPKI